VAEHKVVIADVATAAASGDLSATVIIRSYFSAHHYYNSRHFTALCRQREEALSSRGVVADGRHRAYVIGAVLSSASFLEAFINELFQDAYDGYVNRLGAFDENARSLMASLWSVTEVDHKTLSALDKYDLALKLSGHGGLDKGREPYQSARLVVQARNFLVHYKPTDLGDNSRHHLEDKLKGRFDGSKLMAGSGNAWFPDHALGAGMAEWSVTVAEDLVDHFVTTVGIEWEYRRQGPPDDPSDLSI
jgi:hypothetical protein